MFIKLLEMSFTSGVLLLIVIFIRACLFKKLPKKVFVLLWLIVLFKLLIPVSLNSGFSIYSIIESTFDVELGNTSTENDTEENESAQDISAGNAETAGNTAQVYFSEESLLTWPASGAVLINYSMDKTVYFSTLEQYKYNPALIIGGQVGEMIGASAPGVVTNVEQSAQTGTTVTLDMGNGYSAVYGQLKEVPLEVGDYVDAGQTVGYLSEPTKYYSVEGPNLYFEVLKDGAPVNPMDFMES